MRIDYEPEIDYSVKCKHCGCEYTFGKIDLQLKEICYDTLIFPIVKVYKSYVVCPFCGVEHYIEFKKEKKNV